MTEQKDKQNLGLDEVAKGAQAAGKLRGAIKTGKSIAAAAKGAAAGPYGAAISVLWENRKLAMRALLAIAIVLAIPVLFVMMLPAIIFNGFNSPADTPILNDDAAIMANYTEAENIVWLALQESHDVVLDEIQKQIEGFGDNESGFIEDDYVGGVDFDSVIILSQYCAAKAGNETFIEISLDDLRETIEPYKGDFFSFTVDRQELREVDSETEEEIIYVEYHFQVHYIGNEFFADTIFELEEEERILANNYAQNLMLHLYGVNYAIGVGMALSDDVLRYSELITQYAQQYGIADYFSIIAAVMMVESGGRGNDVMGASLFHYNTQYPQERGGITDPEYSIDVGIHYLADCLAEASCDSPLDSGNVSLALQAYNYGIEFIAWAQAEFGGYSETSASEYARKMIAEKGGSTYGNPRYVTSVMKYYLYPAYGGMEGWGSPFVGRNWRAAVSSEFGSRTDPVTGQQHVTHAGIDIAYPTGTPINAVRSGTVRSVIYSTSGYGYHFWIDHGNGETTLYAHCSNILVKEGEQVFQGQVVALVGSTGKSTGPHLHLNVEINGVPKNPRLYIN